MHRARLSRLGVAAVTAIVAGSLASLAPIPGSPPPPVAAAPVPAAPVRSGEEATTAALAHLAQQRSALSLDSADIAGIVVTDVVPIGISGGSTAAWVVHVQQRFEGLDVAGATLTIVVDGSGTVRSLGDRFERRLSVTADGPPPTIDAITAVRSAVDALGLVALRPFRQIAVAGAIDGGAEEAATITTGGVSADPIPVRLVLQPDTTTDAVHLAWEVTIREPDGENWWVVSVDADTGAEVDRVNYTSGATYEGFAEPVESPSFGARTTIVDPADPVASPFGWHDTDGLIGAEFTVTRGNNASAYTDVDANNQPDPSSQPDGGAGLVFTAPLNLGVPPATSTDAAVINAFQFVNRLHDVAYAFGFDEAGGNFQTNNYGRGGSGALGGDAVLVEVLDGSGADNANFTTPPDGQPGRLQLMPFVAATPDRDSAFDNSIIAHEYAHGISNRLTGGPSNVSCLQNLEQPGEGWSDWFALMMTIEPADLGSMPRPFATWVLGQPANGPGLRSSPYSTDLGVDPSTYAHVAAAAGPHAVGEVFAAMLWDLSWALIDRDGFDPAWIGGTGGNITAMQLVFDGMKLQPCSPGFVDARDAILLADQIRTGGSNQCLIWRAFARRGLGQSAWQGSPASRTDGIPAFDVPDDCLALVLTTTASLPIAAPGSTVVYSSTVHNTSTTAAAGVVVESTVPAGSTYVDGSATCAGVHTAGTVRVELATLAAGASIMCTYAVTVGATATSVWLHEDFEHGTDRWARTHTSGSGDWFASGAAAHSGVLGGRADGAAVANVRALTLESPIPVSGSQPRLRFLHSYDAERQRDGGIVELSTNGVTWADLGPSFVQQGYTHQLANGSNPIGPRPAFTGVSAGVVESIADLTPWVGQSVTIRFRFGSDNGVASTGWRIDEVRLGDEVVLAQSATVSSAAGAADATTTNTLVRGDLPQGTGLLRVTTDPPVPSRISVDGIARNDWGLDWVTVLAGPHEICWSDVVGFATPACQTVVVSAGQTTVATGSFAQLGLIQAGVQPPGLPTTVFVDGHVADEYGLFSFIEPGLHEVCWGDVPGPWQSPPCQTVSVVAGATTQITGTFATSASPTPGPAPQLGVTGLLRVSTSPAVASRIVVDGIPRADWALTWVKMPIGVHEVCFAEVVGFAVPSCQQVLIEQGLTTQVQGVFAPHGLIQASVAPAGLPVDILIDGEPHNQFGSFMFIEPGPHEVCGTRRAGWVTPACATVTVTGGAFAPVTLTYVPEP